jgi:hypothetical protein
MCVGLKWIYLCNVAALYPIDTIKTRMQAMIGGEGVKALIQSGGGRGLYAGQEAYEFSIVPYLHH